MTAEDIARGRVGRAAIVALCIAGPLVLAGCASERAEAGRTQQQALERARTLCGNFGYAPGTIEFAQCAQAEYDRQPATAAAQAAVPPMGQPVQAQPASPPPADSSDDWLVRYLKRPPICDHAACSVR